jgi:hypothetical protein
MEAVEQVENKKRKLQDADEQAVLQANDNVPQKKTKVISNSPVADLLIFGSGEQGNQLPLELCAKVKFRRKPAVIKQFEDTKIRQVCSFSSMFYSLIVPVSYLFSLTVRSVQWAIRRRC